MALSSSLHQSKLGHHASCLEDIARWGVVCLVLTRESWDTVLLVSGKPRVLNARLRREGKGW